MKKITASPDFDITLKKLFSKNSPPHRHHYFEMIYIITGSGTHFINDSHFNYAAGDLILMLPQDLHSFKVNEPGEFCVIDFTSSFFSFINSNEKSKYPFVNFEQMEYIFHNHRRIKGNIEMDEHDKIWTETLFNRLLWEQEQKDFGKVNKHIVFLLLQIISDYISREAIFPLKTIRARKFIQDIINYIHQNIYDKNAIRVENIAKKFFKTKDYISFSFKKHTKISLKNYISNYKLELAKTRLLYSNLTIAAIAAELDFTDESHLNKAFKKVYKKTAKQFRDEN